MVHCHLQTWLEMAFVAVEFLNSFKKLKIIQIMKKIYKQINQYHMK